MSTLPLLMSLADELDNINTRTFPDDFGLGFYPHRHYNRNPSLQLSLPSDTEWLEQRRQSRTTRKYYSTESPKKSASPTTTTTNHYQNINDSSINDCIEQNENEYENEEENYDAADDNNVYDKYIRSNSKNDSKKFPATVKVAIPANDSKQQIIDIKKSNESISSNHIKVKETKKLNNSKMSSRIFGHFVDEACNAIHKDGGKNKKTTIQSK